MQNMMKRAQEMQTKVADLQSELARRSFEASSGGGMVKATVSGALRVVSLEIEPALASGGDRDMLQDLTAAAVNAALTKAQDTVQSELATLQQSMLTGLGG